MWPLERAGPVGAARTRLGTKGCVLMIMEHCSGVFSSFYPVGQNTCQNECSGYGVEWALGWAFYPIVCPDVRLRRLRR